MMAGIMSLNTSRKMIALALKMDRDGDDNIMQTENAYFDATHSRMHCVKSFGLWVYHPSVWHILHLASMEIQSENSQDIAQFFKLFNELVAKVSKTEGKCSIQDFSCVMKVGLITKQLE